MKPEDLSRSRFFSPSLSSESLKEVLGELHWHKPVLKPGIRNSQQILMSWLSLSCKVKRCPTVLNALCFSVTNIWCWVMSELNVLDITSQPCEIQHSVKTSAFSLVSGACWVDGCGHKALKNDILLFWLHKGIQPACFHYIGQSTWMHLGYVNTVQMWQISSSVADNLIVKYCFQLLFFFVKCTVQMSKPTKVLKTIFELMRCSPQNH